MSTTNSTASTTAAVRPAPRRTPAPDSTPPHRVLMIEANEDGTVGGSHQALYDLVRHLDRRYYEPVLLFYQDNRFAEALRAEGFEVHLYDQERARERAVRLRGNRVTKMWDLLGAVARRRTFLDRHRIDAVHINNSPAVGNDDWLPAARLRRIPAVANAMGDARGPRGTPLHAWLFRRFDRVLPISNYMTEAMLAHGIPPDRLVSIRLGVDIPAIKARVRRSRASVREEFGVPEGRLLLAMVGNVREWKGQHVLLEALSHLNAAERAAVHVLFAGAVHADGTAYQQRLLDLEERIGGDTHISWLGAREDVPDLFAAADLAVHCSIKPEPFGLVVTEALALGTPVAATDFGGPAEVVTEDCGWLYDAGRPEDLAGILRSVMADRDVLESKSRGAIERSRIYSVERTVERTVEVYDGLFNGRHRPRGR